MRKTIALTFILTGILVFSVFNTLATKAITLEEVQAQIQQLLQAINNLKIQIQTMNQVSPSIQPQPSTSSCPFVSLMYRGYSESATSETTELQKFLKQYPSIYPEGLVTGYFGRLTEAAVSRFQTQYGIQVTGQVGPQTRAKLCSFWQGGTTQAPCGWCGNTCVRKTTGMYCADVAPPAGYECKEVNGVCQQVAISQTQLPDLTITDLTCSPNNNIQLGQSTYCTITIKNNGSVDAQTHKLEAFVWGKSAFSVYGIVSAGQTEQATFSWQCTEAGDFTVKAVVDSENIIQESNESNNAKTISICCGCNNSTSISVACAASPNPSVINQTVTFSSYGYYGTPPYSYVWSGDVTGAGQFIQTTFSSAGTKAGTVTVTDSKGQTSWATCYATISSSQSVSLPDLTVANLTAKTPLNIGETITISAMEKNIGTVAAGHHFSGIFEDNIETPLGYLEINTILPGYNPYITASYTCSRAGTHTISATIDYIHQIATGEVLESNENNNTETIPITCVAPPSNLTVSCDSGAVNDTAKVGDYVAFFALPYGGSGTYYYSWTGDVTGSIPAVGKTFTTSGTKTATVKVTDSNGATATASCSVLITVSNVSIYPTQTGCIKSPAYNEDTCSGYRLIKTLNYSAACYSLSQCLAVQGDGTCVKSPVYQGDTCSGYRLMSGVSRSCYTYDQCLAANQASFLESLRIQLAQLNELVKKLTASLIEMNR